MGQQLPGKRRISIDHSIQRPRSGVARAWHRLVQWGLQALEEHKELYRWEQESETPVSRYR